MIIAGAFIMESAKDNQKVQRFSAYTATSRRGLNKLDWVTPPGSGTTFKPKIVQAITLFCDQFSVIFLLIQEKKPDHWKKSRENSSFHEALFLNLSFTVLIRTIRCILIGSRPSRLELNR